MNKTATFLLKFTKGAVELAFAAALFAPAFLFYLLPLAALERSRRKRPVPRRAMYLLHGTTLDNLAYRGDIDETVHEKSLDGYFERAVVCYFANPKNGDADFGSGVTAVEMRQIGVLRWTAFVVFLLRCARLICSERITLVRGQDPYWVGLASVFLGKLFNLPHCVSIHTDFDLYHELSGGVAGPFFLGSRRLAKVCERWTLSHSPFVLAISEYIGRYCVSVGARPESIRIIYHGQDPSAFAPEPDAETFSKYIRPGRVNLACAGRIHREKNVFDVVDFAVELRRRNVPFHFLICGDGPHRADFEAALETEKLSGDFTLTGLLPSTELTKVMKAADINVCLMSGFVLIEAAMSGKPVVAYRVEWHEELIRNNETGLLVEKSDASGFCDAVLRLRDDPALATRLAAAARELATKNHTIPHTQIAKRNIMDEIYKAFGK